MAPTQAPRPGTALPHLSASHSRLLQAYFRARCDIFLLAENEHLPVTDLIAWSQSPAIKARLAALKELADNSTHLRTSQARLLALDKLEHIVKTTDDPQELRRAASTIYRGGCAMPQPRSPKKPDPEVPPKPYLPAAHRRRWGSDPYMHPAFIPLRPTPHDSFANSRATSPPPPPAGEVPPLGAAEGVPRSPTLRKPIAPDPRDTHARAPSSRILSRTPSRATPIPPRSRASPRKPARTPAPPPARPSGPRPVRSPGSRRTNLKGRGPPLSR